MPNTYTELLKTTVGTATSSVTLSLSGISGYTDLVLVINATADSGNPDSRIKFNGNTSNNMSGTILTGNGTTASSARRTSLVQMEIDWTGMGTGIGQYIVHIMNYANTTTYKTFLARAAFAAKGTDAIVGMWANTAAITSITLDVPAANYVSGSTFSLYGIANADQGAAKATGGIITEDSQYWYHTFGASGAFIPKQSLTADILVVAGGGGGGGGGSTWANGGGGGAGGLTYYASQSLTATSYTCTVGAGGAGGVGYNTSGGSNGVNSSFTGLTASVGGGFGGGWAQAVTTGGSGGGGAGYTSIAGNSTGASGTAGQGNSGGNGFSNPNSDGNGGGGGGAGSIGQNNTVRGALFGGNGGTGSSSYSVWLTAAGLGTSGLLAGGGGGGAGTPGNFGIGTAGGGNGGGGNVAGSAGLANTGGGGGGAGAAASGGASNGGAGGSGLVIVRYAK
jgi:hypothetical protein